MSRYEDHKCHNHEKPCDVVVPCPPIIPPVPQPLCGNSIIENQEQVVQTVNVALKRINDYTAECVGLLNRIEATKRDDGAYYHDPEVTTEEGYNVADSTSYKVTRIKGRGYRNSCCCEHTHHHHEHDGAHTCCQCGKPFFEPYLQLHLAYNDTTNAGVNESATQASEIELADKLFGIWQNSPLEGIVTWRGLPIPAQNPADKWTLGLSRTGRLKVYASTTTRKQLDQDAIENSFGVSGVLVRSGSVDIQGCFDNSQKVARVAVGQNYDTNEIIVVSVGGYNTAAGETGMTAATLAELMLSFGCTMAVELSAFDKAVAMDKGAEMFTPNDNIIPSLSGFMFLSKRVSFRSRYPFELAELFQKYNALAWQIQLVENRTADNEADIAELFNEIDRLDDELAELNAALTAEIERAKAAEAQLQANINAEEDARVAADDALGARIDQEINDRTAADNALGGRIDQEISDRKAADAELAEGIQAEEDARIQGDLALQDQISTIKGQITEINNQITALSAEVDQLDARETAHYNEIMLAITSLQTRQNALENSMAALQGQVTSMDTTILSIMDTISGIETDLNTLKELVQGWGARITTLEETVAYLSALTANFRTEIDSLAERVTALENAVGDNPWKPYTAVCYIVDEQTIQDWYGIGGRVTTSSRITSGEVYAMNDGAKTRLNCEFKVNVTVDQSIDRTKVMKFRPGLEFMHNPAVYCPVLAMCQQEGSFASSNITTSGGLENKQWNLVWANTGALSAQPNWWTVIINTDAAGESTVLIYFTPPSDVPNGNNYTGVLRFYLERESTYYFEEDTSKSGDQHRFRCLPRNKWQVLNASFVAP